MFGFKLQHFLPPSFSIDLELVVHGLQLSDLVAFSSGREEFLSEPILNSLSVFPFQ
jgi:hypothetical protein